MDTDYGDKAVGMAQNHDTEMIEMSNTTQNHDTEMIEMSNTPQKCDTTSKIDMCIFKNESASVVVDSTDQSQPIDKLCEDVEVDNKSPSQTADEGCSIDDTNEVTIKPEHDQSERGPDNIKLDNLVTGDKSDKPINIKNTVNDNRDDKGDTTTNDKGDTIINDKGDTIINDKGDTIFNDKGDTTINDKGDTIINDKGDTTTNDKGDTTTNDKGDTIINEKGDTTTNDKGDTTINDKGDTISNDKCEDLMEYRSKVESVRVDGTSDSSADSSDTDEDDDKINETTDTQINRITSEQKDDTVESEKRVKLNRHGFEDIRTQGELLPEDLPPLEELTITVDESVVMVEVGTVASIVGILVVIKSNEGVPPLNDDTILFMEGHKVIGQVFEVFGPVKTPWYSVRFNEADNISLKGLSVGMPVYYAPREESFTKLVFVDTLRQLKGSDASWNDNNEPPEQYLDYSDDESERRAKAKRRGALNGESGGDNKTKKNRNRGSKKSTGENVNDWNPFKGNNNKSSTTNSTTIVNQKSYPSWPPNQNSYNRPRFENSNTTLNRPRFENSNTTLNRPRFENSNTTLNRPRFGQVTPMGGRGCNHKGFGNKFNSNWTGANQNRSTMHENRINSSAGVSMFTGQVNVDLTRPPPPFANMQCFGLNQQQMNNQFQAANYNIQQNCKAFGGNPSVNQANFQQFSPMIQQNNLLNQSNIQTGSGQNSNLSGSYGSNLSAGGTTVSVSQFGSQTFPCMNAPVQSRVQNPPFQGQQSIVGGSHVTSMAANHMMTQQVVQNDSLVPIMNQTNIQNADYSFQGYPGSRTANNHQQYNNQSYINVGQFGTQSHLSTQVAGANSGTAMFLPNSVHTAPISGANVPSNIVDPRFIQNNANM